MVSGNYPPGTSRRDLIRGGIIEPHDHEHEWRPHGEANPIIEDGAAIFSEECAYAEGRYGEGWSCNETRSYRFEYDTLESPDGDEWELPTIDEWNSHALPEEIAERVITIEEQFHYTGPADEKVEIDLDPDPEYGQVTLRKDGWQLHFRP